ncbi:hypothetical protein J7F02_27220 [Streptomyces sp. ISL-112]|uniref:hypothetical protein n=1 Tax=unclassified Streptomyces TaxID=2593676 RepID=UPI001BE8C6C5|nr:MULTISPECIES: hypothetical protein [unclassified Streptomyces]MBT2429211.1 hypothetical protein [Streptomyces sp. ISL-112]MBT2463541.1 hypothetical protein [Streptomyces sp. ISL-63]
MISTVVVARMSARERAASTVYVPGTVLQPGQRPQILPGQETRLVVEAEGGEGRVDGLPFRDFLGLLKGAGDPSLSLRPLQ